MDARSTRRRVCRHRRPRSGIGTDDDHRRTRDGADARRSQAGDVHPAAGHGQESAGHPLSLALQRRPARQKRCEGPARRPCGALRLCVARRARSLCERRRVLPDEERGAGRLRRHRVARAAAVVRRQRGNGWRQLPRLHAARGGDGASAAPARHLGGSCAGGPQPRHAFLRRRAATRTGARLDDRHGEEQPARAARRSAQGGARPLAQRGAVFKMVPSPAAGRRRPVPARRRELRTGLERHHRIVATTATLGPDQRARQRGEV